MLDLVAAIGTPLCYNAFQSETASIIGQLSDVIGCDDAVEDWRRVAAAVDAITGAKSP